MLDAYILVKWTISVTKTETAIAQNNRNKKLIFRNCAPFIDCVSEINKTQVDNAKDIDVVISMYHLIEHSDNY